jgi:pyruvate formate lyase activating enzyme
MEVSGVPLAPEEIVRKAVASGCRSISYTYTEPTIFYEYAYETALLAHRAGLKNVYLDAANIDLKGYSEKFYREVVHAMLSEVLASILEYKRQGIWIELTTLVIPSWNDSPEELRAMARFIAEEVGVDTPWHVTQFYPTYKLTDQPRTPVATLRQARQIGLDAGLHYVYEGNVPGEGGENTYCPQCCEPLIRRYGFSMEDNRIEGGKCPRCRAVIAGIGM